MPQGNSTTPSPPCPSPTRARALPLPDRVREHLPVLVGDQPRDLLGVTVEQLPEREEDLGPLAERGLRPGGERVPPRGDGRADVLLVGQEHLTLLLARRRVEHPGRAVRTAPRRLAPHPVLDRGRHTS